MNIDFMKTYNIFIFHYYNINPDGNNNFYFEVGMNLVRKTDLNQNITLSMVFECIISPSFCTYISLFLQNSDKKYLNNEYDLHYTNIYLNLTKCY